MTGVAVFDAAEVVISGDRVAFALPLPSPVNRGHLDAWISRTKGGPPASGAMVRQVKAAERVLPPLTLFGRDLRAAFPKGGRAFLVVSYAGVVLGSGPVVLVA